MGKHHDWLLKYNYVMRYINGESPRKLGIELNINLHPKSSIARIFQWNTKYQKNGIQGLKRKEYTLSKPKKKPKKEIDYSQFTYEQLIEINKLKDKYIESVLNDDKKKKFSIINNCNICLPINILCDIFGVSKSGYYKWLKTKTLSPSYDLEIISLIRAIYYKFNGIYGVERIWRHIKYRMNININIKTVRRYMRFLGLKSKIRIKSKPREAKMSFQTYGDKINKNFKATAPNQKWFSDVSYLQTNEGWRYVSVVIDSFDNSIIDLKISKTQNSDLICNNVRSALGKFKYAKPIINTDHHAIYFSNEYQKLISEFNFIPSMGEAGDSLANRPAEYWFGILKCEWLYWIPMNQLNAKRLNVEVNDFRNFYQNERLQSSLNNMTPSEYSKKFYNNLSPLSME